MGTEFIEKKTADKWTCAVQTQVVQRSTVYIKQGKKTEIRRKEGKLAGDLRLQEMKL